MNWMGVISDVSVFIGSPDIRMSMGNVSNSDSICVRWGCMVDPGLVEHTVSSEVQSCLGKSWRNSKYRYTDSQLSVALSLALGARSLHMEDTFQVWLWELDWHAGIQGLLLYILCLYIIMNITTISGHPFNPQLCLFKLSLTWAYSVGYFKAFFCLYGCGGHYCIPSLRRCQKSIIALFAHLGRKFRSVWNLTTYSMDLEKDMQPSSPFWFKISDSKLKCSLISIRNRECEYVYSHVCGRQRATSGVIYDRVFVFARHILYRWDSFSNYEVRRLKFPWFIQSPLTGTIPQSILFPISRQ